MAVMIGCRTLLVFNMFSKFWVGCLGYQDRDVVRAVGHIRLNVQGRCSYPGEFFT